MVLRTALVSTNQFARWAGSEVVATELVEALDERGIDVTLFSNVVSEDLAVPLRDRGVRITDDPEDVNVWEKDLVYCQHRSFGRLFCKKPPETGTFPVFVFNHLSPYAQLEEPGPHFERAFGDIVLTNSPETRAALERKGPDFKASIEVFPNPAPAAFERPNRGPRTSLKRLLCVSNHVPPEMRKALRQLENLGVVVERIGRKGVSRRVLPSDLDTHDAVVTIGKTVQYAIAARIPVFCYDRFGGPGWLSSENVQAAADANFSGRCCESPREPETLVQELRAGFAAADAFAVDVPDAVRVQYSLGPHLTSVLERACTLRADESRSAHALSLLVSETWKSRLEEERQAAETASEDFLAVWAEAEKLDRRRQRRYRIRRFFGLPQ